MREFKELTEFKEMLSNVPSKNVDEKKVKALFEKLLKQLEIDKEIFVYDNIYLQPFKLEYVGTEGGLKNYMVGLEAQRKEKAQNYSKLVRKNGGKLEVIKSFGKIEKMTDNQFAKLLLLVRLSQYVIKARELYALEVGILQIL
ncbi:MAG: hypothetical protein AB7E13_09780 [Arcobacteraceae bacterium]